MVRGESIGIESLSPLVFACLNVPPLEDRVPQTTMFWTCSV